MEDQAVLHRLPKRRIDSCKKKDVKVGPSSTIRVNHNVYSVNSRLIGEGIQDRLYMKDWEYGTAKKRLIPCQGCGVKENTKSTIGILLTA